MFRGGEFADFRLRFRHYIQNQTTFTNDGRHLFADSSSARC